MLRKSLQCKTLDRIDISNKRNFERSMANKSNYKQKKQNFKNVDKIY
jgi:hypothetical protein